MNKIIDVCEHSIIDGNFEDDLLTEFNDLFKKDDAKYLGLHQEFEDYSLLLKSHYYIGYRWIDKENHIHISAKKYNNYKADYLGMLLKCLDDPIVSKELNDTYEIFFDEPWIEIDGDEDEITPLIILHFLKVVKKVSRKGLKKGYIKITENMTSKVKGKILINETIKQNHFKNRLDKTVCNHQIFTINCIENKIIKTALSQCGRRLHGFANHNITKMLRQNLNAFELVDNKEVFDSDFSKIKYSPFYKEYQEALRLAKMIFKRFGFSLESNLEAKKHKIPPFYINMPELFERYVEVQLREKYNNDLVPGYGQKDGSSYKWGLRPDFVVKNSKMIIDAKYKYWFEDCNDCIMLKDDFQQLSLYGRVKEIKEKIGLGDSDEEAVLVFIYPSHEIKDIELNFEEDNVKQFSNIKKIGLKIPTIG